jgi:LmbE family N-acetylglucosaminyl deacetylase
MKRLLISLFALSVCFNCCAEKSKGKTILVVFAHPDDETSIGPLLVKYSKADKIYLIIVTDGRLGTKPGFPTGDTLVRLRQTESECACKLMGIEPPIFLGFPDGFNTNNDVARYLEQSKQLKEELTKKIEELKPDIIITFGPDGDTGHPDHRMVSDMTTEVILREGWADKIPLYYLGWLKKDDEKFRIVGGLNTVDPKYLNVAIKFSEEDEQIAMRALECDKSQFSPEEIKEWQAIEKKDTSNTLYFRQLSVSSQKKTSL